MRSLVFALPFLFVLLCHADQSVIDCFGVGSPQIMCRIGWEGNTPDLPEGPSNVVMSSRTCTALKQSVFGFVDNVVAFSDNIIFSAENILTDADQIDEGLYGSSADVHNVAHSLWVMYNNDNSLTTISNNAVRLDNVHSTLDQLHGNIMSIKGEAAQIKTRSEFLKANAQSVEDMVTRVSCVEGQECQNNGNGTATCPCTVEFDTLTAVANNIRAQLAEWWAESIKAYQRLQQIEITVSNSVDYVQKMYERLNAPDDRAWSDINGMLQDLIFGTTNKLAEIQSRTLVLSDLLYKIRRAIQENEEGNEFHLTNEGLIALYGLIGQYSTYGLMSVMTENFNQQFGSFSNSVYTLFNQFNSVALTSGGFANNNLFNRLQNNPTHLYNVATNYNLSALSRYAQLMIPFQGGLTNWFSRMEYYQQALLGWYEDRSPDSELTESQPKHETSIENMVSDATNVVGGVSAALGNSSNVLHGVVAPVANSLGNARLSVSLPSHVVLFPDVTIMDYDMEFHIDTSRISEYCDKARDITTLIWVVGFWVSCVVGIGVIVKTGIKAALWLIKYISQTS